MVPTSTILIVDDLPAMAQLIATLLGADGYQLEYAFSGAEALEKAAALDPDLILLDVMMPEMDGFAVCRQLRAAPRLADIPIIMITALDDRASRIAGLEAGADDFISKPFDPAELRARVRAITRLNRYRRLLAERARYERLIELSPDGIFILDQAGQVRLVNPAMLRMLGADNEAQVLNLPAEPFIEPSHFENCKQAFGQRSERPAQKRSLAADGEFTLLAYLPSQAPGSTVGASYSYQDADVQADQSYWYRLAAIDVNGAATLFDPISVTFVGPTAVTLSSVEASPAAAPSLPLAGALLALLLAPVGAAWARRRG